MKKNLTHRLFALSLAALLVFPFAACAGDGDTADTTAPPSGSATTAPAETTAAPETELVPNLPEIRFDNTGKESDAQFVVLTMPENHANYPDLYMTAEELDGDIINDAVFKRNSKIEEKYGIKISKVENGWPENLLKNSVSSNSDEFDLVYCRMNLVGSLALGGNLHNIADLPNVNYDMPWWDSSAREAFTVGDDKLYTMVSDISMMVLSGVRAMIFNRDLIRDNQLEDPYALVAEDKWTLDKMGEMINAISVDLNGDTRFDDSDRYGMLTEKNNIDYLAVGTGIQFIKQNSDGTYTENFMNEKTINLIEKWASYSTDKTRTLDYEDLNLMPGVSKAANRWLYGRMLFAEDKFLFVQGGVLLFDELARNEMESEYGIVPNPKLDEKQERYYHLPDPWTCSMMIPSTNPVEDLNRIGIILEDLSYESSKELLPQYYETLIKTRRARVPEMGEMVDLIKNSIGYQLESIFPELGMTTVLREAYRSGNPASSFEAARVKTTALLEQFARNITTLP